MNFHPPLIEKHDGILVVRDDLIPGGTKRRGIHVFLTGGKEFVYASPACGYAQVALSFACREYGYKATIFTAKRKTPHARTLEAIEADANVVMVPHGYLSNVQAKAKQYSIESGSVLVPFGLDREDFLKALSEVAEGMDCPKEVWTVAGSGVLTRCLQKVWRDTDFFAIQVGKTPDAGKATLLKAPERFEWDAKYPPPFPSCSNYDAKAWRFVKEFAKPGALFWNVAG